MDLIKPKPRGLGFLVHIASKGAFVLKHCGEISIFHNKLKTVIMKKLLILLLFSNCIYAQIDPSGYPIFNSCKDVKVDEMRDCFLNELYDQLYLRLKEEMPKTGKTQSIQIFFAVDDQGEFTHFANSATSEIVNNAIASAFKGLPRIQPARFLEEPSYERFGIILKIPLQKDGSLSEILTSAVPPPPPAPEIIAVVENDVEIEEVIIEIEDPEVLSYTESIEVEEALNKSEPEKVPFAIIQ